MLVIARLEDGGSGPFATDMAIGPSGSELVN